jgi:hypothetical protein
MEAVTRDSIFALAAKKLRQDFEELVNVPHAGARGGEAEKLVAEFFKAHIPRRFDVGAGFILDLKGVVSSQTDVIIYDAINCPTYRASEAASIFPANNVAAVIEVKSKLDGRALDEAFEKIKATKALIKSRTNGPQFDQTHCSIFAFDSALTLDTIADRLAAWTGKSGIGPHPDLICVLDKGFVTTVCKIRGHDGWGVMYYEGPGGRQAEGSHIGLGTHVLGEKTVDAYFRLVLAHLINFRWLVDHPGFKWSDSLPHGGQVKVTYLTSMTNEVNPRKRKEKLDKYRAQAMADFAQQPVPRNWPE